MAAMELCQACGMEYDWPGVDVDRYRYCCEACSRGEKCTCPEHDHQYFTDQPLPRAAGEQLGLELRE